MPFQIGGRATLVIDDGPFAGASCDVDTIDSEAVLYAVVTLTAAFSEAQDMPAELEALRALCAFFDGTGRPVWNVCGPRGPIPATAAGMLLVPGQLVLQFTAMWQETFDADAKADAPVVAEPDDPTPIAPARRTKTAASA